MRAFIAARGGSVGDYDAIRANSLQHLEAFAGSVGVGYGVGGVGLAAQGSVEIDTNNVVKGARSRRHPAARILLGLGPSRPFQLT